MKILVICQYYYPEPFRITDICEELVKQGHDLTVVTGLPNYPMGEIYDGYRKGKKRDEVLNGVKIHRCFTIGRRHGAIFRFLNYYSFAISSKRYVKKLKEEYDVVFVNQLSPVMMASAGIAYKKKHKTKLVLYCLDLWPESLVAGGIKQGSFLFNYYKKISEKIYKQADKILVTSKSFSDYFKKMLGITDTEHLPQYAEDLFSPEDCKKEPDEFIDLMFAGNIGAAQGITTIVEAVRLTQDIKNLRWHIVGDGSQYENIKVIVKDLNNVFFYGRQPLEKMPEFYSKADAMLVTLQKDTTLSMTLPGKVQTYMAAGKPIIGAIDGEARLVIEESGCGFCVNAGDAVGLSEQVRNFIASDDKQKISENAVKYYNANFKKNIFIEKLIGSLGEHAI